MTDPAIKGVVGAGSALSGRQDVAGFLSGGGNIATRIAAFDWESTPLGSLDTWPESRRTVLGVMLRAPVPMVTLWGAEGVMIYNDAYAAFSGSRHPGLLGRNVRDAWPEVAAWNDGVMRTCLAGGTLSYRDQMLELNRTGTMERVWLNLDYSPVLDAAGTPVAVLAVVLETTAKVRAEMQLQDEKGRLQEMFAQAPGLMAMLEGPDHVFTQANAAYMALVGGRPMVGLPIRSALPEVVEQGFVELLDKVRNTGVPIVGRGVPVVLERNGAPEERFVDFVYQPIRTDGAVTGIFVQGHDMTDQKRTEIALRESEARFRLVAESAPVMLWMSNADGSIAYLNAAQRAFWAKAPEEMATFAWRETIHPDDAGVFAAPYSDAMEHRTGFSIEARLRRADGAWRRILTVAQPRFGAEDDFLGMIGVNVDVTDMRETEAAIRDETRRLATLNRTGAAIAAELDLGRIVQLVCDACVVLTEAENGAFLYESDDAHGVSYALSGAPWDADEDLPAPTMAELLRTTFAGERIIRSHDLEADPRHASASPFRGMLARRVRSLLAVPVVSRSGEVIGGLFFGHAEPGRFTARHEDIVAGIAGQAAVAMDNARLFEAAEREVADRRRAEAALQALNETLETRVVEEVVERSKAEAALRQSQKLEAIGKLTGGVAHDFNNLLQVISGNLQLLGRGLRGDAQAERRVADALSGVEKGAKLASQLLAFSRRQPLEPRVVNVGRLVAGMGEMLRRTIGEGIDVETRQDPDLWNCLVDPTQLEAAILNLALNARDAMGEGGRLTIATGNAQLGDDLDAEEVAEVAPEATARDYVALTVTDTGTGIAPEILDQVFEPFFSTKPQGKGTGLGLSMVYGFVRQSGGHVRIISEPGRGTEVRLYLPRSDRREDTPVAPEGGPVVGGSETVLVAEDDDEVRSTVVALLTDLGYRVVTARDAAAALDVIDSGVPVDLLFTDVVMPGRLRSPELARLARERRPGIAVLFTSGYTEDAITRDGRLDPGVELISKPYTREALARKLRAVLGPARETPPAQQMPPADRPLTVLVVEDEPLILMNTADTLRDFGMTVLEAGSQAEARAALADGTVPDVVIVDVGLPDGSGVELAGELRAGMPGLPVVFATGRSEVPGAEAMGAAILVKPYGEAQLVESVRRMAAQRT